MRMNRRGFTLIELLVVIVIIGILTRIALPKFRDMKDRAVATQVIGAIMVVRTAAFNYFASNNAWPPSAGKSAIPAGLASSLPVGFKFNQKIVQLRWQQLTLKGVPYGLIRAYPTTISICSKLYTTLGGKRNNNIVAVCSGGAPRIDFYVDR